jgi:hypothetical protein
MNKSWSRHSRPPQPASSAHRCLPTTRAATSLCRAPLQAPDAASHRPVWLGLPLPMPGQTPTPPTAARPSSTSPGPCLAGPRQPPPCPPDAATYAPALLCLASPPLCALPPQMSPPTHGPTLLCLAGPPPHALPPGLCRSPTTAGAP